MQKISTHHNKDKVFKESLTLFLGQTLKFLSTALAGVITQILTTEITQTDTKKAFADLAFLLSTGIGAHFEMEVDISWDDLLRFAGYNIDLTRLHKTEFITVIITMNKPKHTEYISKTVTFKPIIICLKDRNGDEILQNMKESLAKGEPINEIELVYLPFYGSESGKTQYDLADSAIKLTMEEKDLHKRNKLQSLLLLQMSKFAKEEDFRKLLEDNAMNLDGNLLVKVLEERGFNKGKAEGKIETTIETALKMLKKGFSMPQIAELLEQPIEWVENLQNQLAEI